MFGTRGYGSRSCYLSPPTEVLLQAHPGDVKEFLQGGGDAASRTKFPTAHWAFPAEYPRGALNLPLPSWESSRFPVSFIVPSLLPSLEAALLSTFSQLPSIPFLFWKQLPLHCKNHLSMHTFCVLIPVLKAWWQRTGNLSSNLGWARFLVCKTRMTTTALWKVSANVIWANAP